MQTPPQIEDYDSPWKDVLERCFERFMIFFFPHAHRQIDWSKGFEFLDKELQKVLREARQSRRTVDKLVRVWLKSGKELWVVIHIEVQGQWEADFGRRVFTAHYRLFDRYDRPVASLVVLSDPHPHWRPQEFGYTLFGCSLRLRFPVVKLLDYKKRLAQLERSRNPFALVVLAHLKAQETQGAPRKRMQAKLELMRLLRRGKFSKQEIRDLFHFIDWVLWLPKAEDKELSEILEKEEETMGKKYVTSFERLGMEKGEKIGELKTLRENVCQTLDARFGAVPQEIIEAVSQNEDVDELRLLFNNALRCGSLDEFTTRLSVTV